MLFLYVQSDEMELIKRLARILVLEGSIKTIMYMYICTCIYVYVISESVGLLCEQ